MFSTIHATCVTEVVSQMRRIWCRTSGNLSLNSFLPVSEDEILGDVWQLTVIAPFKKKEHIRISGIEEWQVQICEKSYDLCEFCSGIVIAEYFFNEPIWVAFSNSRQWYLNMGCMFLWLSFTYFFFFVWIVPTPLDTELIRVVTWKYCLLFLWQGSRMSHSLQPLGYRVEALAGEEIFCFSRMSKTFLGPSHPSVQ